MGYAQRTHISGFFAAVLLFCGCFSARTDTEAEADSPPCCVLPESITGIKTGDYPETYGQAKFDLPRSETFRTYLGLDISGPQFALSRISSPVLIVEIFTSYCPYCQEAAETLNELYFLIRDQGLDRKIKMIGIGMASFDAEVIRFEEKYGVVFPLFADPQNTVYAVVGRKKTPYLAVLRRTENNDYRLVMEEEERLGSAVTLLKSIREKTGL